MIEEAKYPPIVVENIGFYEVLKLGGAGRKTRLRSSRLYKTDKTEIPESFYELLRDRG